MADINENRPGYKKTKVGWIPEEWNTNKLGKICEKVQDGNYGAEYPKKSEFVESGIPFLTSKAIGGDGRLRMGKVDYITHDKHLKLKKAQLKLNDILFTNRGANVGTISTVSKEIENGNIGPQLTLLRVNESCKNEFLMSVMTSHIIKKQILRQDSGSAMNFFGIKATSSFMVPLPPLPEQKKIARILSTWDAAIRQLDRLIERKQTLKKGLMQQLLTGRRRFPEFVPAGGTRYQETKLGMVPEDWEVVRVDEVFSFLSTTSYSRKKMSTEIDSGVYCIHYGDIHTIFNKSIIDISEFPGVPMLLENTRLPKDPSFLKSGDLIIADASEDYAGVGECIEVKVNEDTQALAGLHTIALRDTSGKTLHGFRAYLLQHPLVKKELKKIATGANVLGISKSNMKKFEIIIPLLEEQQKMAALMSLVDKEIDDLKEKRERLTLQKKGLMQQLLTGAVRVDSID